MPRSPTLPSTAVLTAFALLLAAGSPLAAADWQSGVTAYRAGDMQRAITQFRQYVADHPDVYQGHQMLGAAYLKAGEAELAATHLKRAVELEPDDPALRVTLARALQVAGRDEAACAVLDPVDAGAVDERVQNQLLAVRAKSGCGGDPLADLAELARRKNDTASWAAYAAAAHKAGHHADASNAATEALRLSPDDERLLELHTRLWMRRALELQSEQRSQAYTRAVASAEDLNRMQDSVESNLLLGEALIGAKEFGRAARPLARAADLAPTQWLPSYYLGQVRAAEDNFEAAENLYEIALAKADDLTNQQRVWAALASLMERRGRFNAAAIYYQRAGRPADAERARANEEIADANRAIDEENEQRRIAREQEREIEEELEKIRRREPPPPR